MYFNLFKHFERDNGLTPNLVKGFVEASSLEEAREYLGLFYSLPRVVENKEVFGYKKSHKHRTVFYLKPTTAPKGKKINSIMRRRNDPLC